MSDAEAPAAASETEQAPNEQAALEEEMLRQAEEAAKAIYGKKKKKKRKEEEGEAASEGESETSAGASSSGDCADRERKKVGPNSFEKLRLLGRGDVGRVYLVKKKPAEGVVENEDAPELYAMKCLSKKEMISRNKVKRCMTEREILATTNHPFIVTLHYSFQSEENLYFVMDYCAGGEFFRALQRQPGKVLSEHAARFYAAEVLSALEYLHMMGFIYRDLKPENILLHSSGHVMLTDFDLSKQATVAVQAKMVRGMFESDNAAKIELVPEVVTNSFVGTAEYIAPEILAQAGHSSAVDWWTFGILIYEMLFGTTPFKGATRDMTFSNIKKGSIRFPEEPAVSSHCKSLIRKLLHPVASKRLGASHGASDIKRHPFFAGIKWALLLHETPPIVPRLDYPTDTRNFRVIRDDQMASSTETETDVSDDSLIETDPFHEFKKIEKSSDSGGCLEKRLIKKAPSKESTMTDSSGGRQ